MRKQQRRKCKGCGHNFIDKPRRGHGERTKGLAVWLYSSGLSQRRIAGLFGVSGVAVMKWIRNFAFAHGPRPVPDPHADGAAVVELDEMCRYLKKVLQDADLKGSSSCCETIA